MKINILNTEITFRLFDGRVIKTYWNTKATVKEIEDYPWCYLETLMDWDREGYLYTTVEWESFRGKIFWRASVRKLLLPKIRFTNDN